MRRCRHLAMPLLAASVAVFAEQSVDISKGIDSEARSSEVWRSEALESKSWELNEVERTRVAALLQGFRGAVSDPRISPIEVLGIHARSDAERRGYADRWARLQIADAERVLAFERAYRAAVRQLLRKRELIDRALLSPRKRSATLQATDRLLYFTRADCAVCEALQRRVLNQVGRLSGVDIYLIDQTSPDAIRAWAREQGIDPARVRAKEVTLNADDGLLEQLTEHSVEAPYLLRQRGPSLKPIVLLDGR